jgi:gamma-glutamyltranspeptidase/glutathione hydrolase
MAAAGEAPAAEAAQAALDAGGTAVDAIIAGFLGAAGAGPAVLFAPVVAVAAGVGLGARAFDGRLVQPGKGASRPRGYTNEAAIPPAARVAAPRSLALLALLHTYRGRLPMSELARAGIAVARQLGCARRAALLRRVATSGPGALRAADVERALVAVGGAVAGGTLTAEDLDGALPGDTAAAVLAAGEHAVAFGFPWPPTCTVAADAEAIVACDAQGLVAALGYMPDRDGVAVDALEITLAKHADPVRRGVARTPPGTTLDTGSIPLVLLSHGRAGAEHRSASDAAGSFWAAFALPGARSIGGEALAELASQVPLTDALCRLYEQTGGRQAIAIVRAGRDAQRLVSPDRLASA